MKKHRYQDKTFEPYGYHKTEVPAGEIYEDIPGQMSIEDFLVKTQKELSEEVKPMMAAEQKK